MFESKTVTAHLVRGAIGFAAIGGAIAAGAAHPWILIVAVPAALFALRGCPMCWILGLVELALARRRGRWFHGHCLDGSCERPPRSAPVAPPQPPDRDAE